MRKRRVLLIFLSAAGILEAATWNAHLGSHGTVLGQFPQTLPTIDVKPLSLEPTLKVFPAPTISIESSPPNSEASDSTPAQFEPHRPQVAASLPDAPVNAASTPTPETPISPSHDAFGWFKAWGGWIALGIAGFCWLMRRPALPGN